MPRADTEILSDSSSMGGEYVPVRAKKASKDIQKMMPAILKTPLVRSNMVSGPASPKLDSGFEFVTFAKETSKREPLQPIKALPRTETMVEYLQGDTSTRESNEATKYLINIVKRVHTVISQTKPMNFFSWLSVI